MLALAASCATLTAPTAVAPSPCLIAPASVADTFERKELASLLMSSFYGTPEAWRGPIAWAQRAIIEADVVNDLTQRLEFYAANPGTVLTARDPASGALLGFADVGLSAYDVARSQYRLPGARADDEGGGGATVARPYLSNLAVDPESRKRGVGRMLVRACEEEVRGWGALDAEPEPTRVWLEVSEDNEAAVSFYERLGYTREGESLGREVRQRAFHFDVGNVRRLVLAKSLPET